ncbi:kinase-like domain-containing protein [Armillaria borealis]|uniref:Kinase-like domain-containing protein n=1 Tax=Armillaria borealis TaxID=47425 RepID=A0AA39JM07_9AGAR|nr:kinase-like domain-containing protein [Armillaria borealis]
MIRIITADGEGHDTLRIVKKICTGEEGLLSSNHALPLLEVFEYNDLTFGVFPRVAVSLSRSINSWLKNTIEDIMDMLMQAIEGIVFIHGRHRIAHRDLFLSNFLLEWHPNTLDPDVKRRVFTRPRVYLIDFKTAVDFPENSTPEERVVTRYPFPLDSYGRPVAPEFQVSDTYDPFALDIWQFGSDLMRFHSTIWEIDEILESMRNEDPRSRPMAAEFLDRLDAVVSGIPPALLRKKPVELPEEPYVMSDSLYRRLVANRERFEAETKERMQTGS